MERSPLSKLESQLLSAPVAQKYHNQLLQQLPKMLANGINMSRPEDYMWLDPSGRPTTPPRAMSPQNKAQCTRKVRVQESKMLSYLQSNKGIHLLSQFTHNLLTM